MTAGVDGQVLRGTSRLARWANFVKVAHTVFALPFVVVGLVAGAKLAPVDWTKVALAVLAFGAARFAAMGFNRIVDRRFDALNPRTAERELPSGRMSLPEAWALVIGMSVVFFLAVWRINEITLRLAPIAWAWTLAYSFTKRFTTLCHFWLGWSLVFAPAGGYLTVTGEWSSPWWSLWVMGIGVSSWVAGFDILYSLQDEAFDREHRLRSLAVALGARGAIAVVRVLHLVAIAALAYWGRTSGMGLPYFFGLGTAAAILAWEHRLVKPGDYSRLDAAFFTMNGIISGVVMLGALADVVL